MSNFNLTGINCYGANLTHIDILGPMQHIPYGKVTKSRIDLNVPYKCHFVVKEKESFF